LCIRRVVQDQRVRARVGDRTGDGRDHAADQLRLHPADGENRGRRMSSPLAGAPLAGVPARARRRRGGRRGRLGWNALGLAVFALIIFPVYWMIATAFKRGSDIFADTPVWFPIHPTLSNFTDAIHRPHFWADVKNSLIIVGCVVALSLVLAFLAALALAKFRFYGRKAFIVLIIGVQMIPLNALIIPIYLVLAKANQVDKLSGVIITYLTFVLPFTVWTLRGFMIGVPRELEEAAQVDGSTRFGAFVRVLLPLIGPGLVAAAAGRRGAPRAPRRHRRGRRRRHPARGPDGQLVPRQLGPRSRRRPPADGGGRSLDRRRVGRGWDQLRLRAGRGRQLEP